MISTLQRREDPEIAAPMAVSRAAARWDPLALVVGLSALLGVVVAASAAVGYARSNLGSPTALLDLGLAIAIAGALFALQRSVVLFDFRGERVTITLDEGVVFFGLMTLPPQLLVPSVLVGVLAAQLKARRPMRKVAFNTGVHTIAVGGAAAGATALVAAGWPPALAALAGTVGYVAFCGLQVAGIFARIERLSLGAVLKERFVTPVLIQSVIGGSVGLVLVGLWWFHPVATLAVIPFVLLARGYTRLAAHVDREVEVRRKLASVAHTLVGTAQLDEVAARVVDTCGSLFATGRVTLSLRTRNGKPAVEHERDFGGGPSTERTLIEKRIIGVDGEFLGTLRVYPAQRTRDEFGPLDIEMLSVVVAQVAAVVENAVILAENRGLWAMQETIVDHVPAGVVYLNATGGVAYQNQHLQRELGLPTQPSPFICGLRQLDEDPRVRAKIVELLIGKPFDDLRLSVQTPGGEAYLVASGVPLFDHSNVLRSEQVKGGILLIRAERPALVRP